MWWPLSPHIISKTKPTHFKKIKEFKSIKIPLELPKPPMWDKISVGVPSLIGRSYKK